MSVTGSLSDAGPWEVYPTESGDTATFIGTPVAQNTQVYLALNNTEDTLKTVGFTTKVDQPGLLARVWSLYGQYVAINVSPARFYGRPRHDGLWELMWSQEDLANEYPIITVRKVPPIPY